MMALSPQDVDPHSSFAFAVEIDSTLAAWFTECTGLQVQMEAQEYKEGGLNAYTHKFLNRVSFGNVTLKWGVTESNALHGWLNDAVRWTASKAGQNPRKHVSIVMFTRDASRGALEERRRWDLIDAFPVKWVAPSLNTTQSQVALESLELAYRYFEAKGK